MHAADLLTLPLRERIRRLRKQRGLSHDRLAAELGTSRQTVIGWEKGARPSARYVAALAAFFDLPAEAFQAPSEEAVTIPNLAARLEELEGAMNELGAEVRALARAVAESQQGRPKKGQGGHQ